ncbi:hypothetical protein HZA96_01185 [Candidatus Woesearchaeota archaeon]|nr:hypothetical protein [Candidatus Woesearchaeota archaeon]
MIKKEQKKSLKHHFLEHHAMHKEHHQKTTEAVFMLGLLLVGFFAFLQAVPFLTGFAVATGDAVVTSASTTAQAVSTINNSDDRLYFKLFAYTVWIMLFGVISVAVVNNKRKKGHYNLNR